MFTALFALARTVGWVAQWNEMIADPDQKIGRPRQLYTGADPARLRAGRPEVGAWVADGNASDDPLRNWRLPVLGWALAIVAFAAILSFQRLFWWLLTTVLPYPFFGLVGVAIIAWIAALLRHAPPGLEVWPRLARPWVISRFAFLAAHLFLLAAWAVTALVRAPVASALLEAFLLTVVFGAMMMAATQCALDVVRAVRGPLRTGL